MKEFISHRRMSNGNGNGNGMICGKNWIQFDHENCHRLHLFANNKDSPTPTKISTKWFACDYINHLYVLAMIRYLSNLIFISICEIEKWGNDVEFIRISNTKQIAND